MPMPVHLDALAGGALLALADVRGLLTARLVRWLLAIGLPCALFIPSLPLLENNFQFVYVVGESLAVLTFVALVAAARTQAVRPLSRFLSARPVVYLGRRSYGIYLYHNFVLAAFAQSGLPKLGKAGLTNLILCSAVTILLAMLSWRFIEQPMLRLKLRFPYR